MPETRGGAYTGDELKSANEKGELVYVKDMEAFARLPELQRWCTRLEDKLKNLDLELGVKIRSVDPKEGESKQRIC